MNKRFDIFMKSADDDILEEAQLYVPRKRSFSKIMGLAACLCIAFGAYMTMGGFGASAEDSSVMAPGGNLYAESATMAASATAAQGEAMTESTVMATSNESALDNDCKQEAVSSPIMPSDKKSLLPANAVVCNFTVTGNEKQIDFSVGEMDFTLTASENDVHPDEKYRNTLLSDKEDETITWYSEDGDTEYILELIEGDYDLLYSTAKEIAGNLGIKISG
ncbi:MAG: hypothetical protein IJE55_05450 [Clostridia bacterium]|nr:hypothetical protein [Clostridia bacterium]